MPRSLPELVEEGSRLNEELKPKTEKIHSFIKEMRLEGRKGDRLIEGFKKRLDELDEKEKAIDKKLHLQKKYPSSQEYIKALRERQASYEDLLKLIEVFFDGLKEVAPVIGFYANWTTKNTEFYHIVADFVNKNSELQKLLGAILHTTSLALEGKVDEAKTYLERLE